MSDHDVTRFRFDGPPPTDRWAELSRLLAGLGLESLSGEWNMPTMETAACPTCGQPGITSIDRPPRETTWDRLGEGIVPQWKTFEPGPEATIVFRCGHRIDGEEGVAWIKAQQTRRADSTIPLDLPAEATIKARWNGSLL